MVNDRPTGHVVPAMLSHALTDDEVRMLLTAGEITLSRPVAIDDTPITDADADRGAYQCGIPSHAVNVRMCAHYLKCDSPEWSVTVSARVECPLGPQGEAFAVLESIAPRLNVDGDKSPERARHYAKYRADLAPGTDAYDPMDWHPYPDAWTAPEAMPAWAVRLHATVTGIGVERVGDVWFWRVRVKCVNPPTPAAVSPA